MNPWPLSSSLSYLFQIREETWLPAFNDYISYPVSAYQILMVLSWVPPPVARTFFYQEHQSRAFIPALWSLRTKRGSVLPKSHKHTILSLPPEASIFPEGFHFRPQISYLCSVSVQIPGFDFRTSKFWILASLPPVVRMNLFQFREETRAEWPWIERICAYFCVSHSWISPLERPTARQLPFYIHFIAEG